MNIPEEYGKFKRDHPNSNDFVAPLLIVLICLCIWRIIQLLNEVPNGLFEQIHISPEIVDKAFQELSEEVSCNTCYEDTKKIVSCKTCTYKSCHGCFLEWSKRSILCPLCRKSFVN
jgi:hypothetical protein